MTGKNEHTGFEKRMKETFSDFSMHPDPAVWSRVEKNLNRRKKLVVFYRAAIAASFLLLLSAGGWWFFNNYRTQSEQQLVPKHETAQSPVTSEEYEVPDEVYNDLIKEQTEKSSAEAFEKKMPGSSEIKPVKKDEKITDMFFDDLSKSQIAVQQHIDKPLITDESGYIIRTEDELSELPVSDVIDDQLPDRADTIEIDVPAIVQGQITDPKQLEYLSPDPDITETKEKSGNWQLAMAYGMIQGGNASDFTKVFNNSDAYFTNDPFSSKFIMESYHHSDIENTTHSHPLTVGIMINRSFSEIWGIESGLLFTRLKSVSKTEIVNNEFVEYGNELYYIGLPFSVRLNMLHSRRFGMYLSQGAVLEKGVRIRYHMQYYVSEVLKDSEHKSNMVEGVQISSLTALGFEYHITETFGIYAQPGLQIFFMNKTQPFNIRSSNAIWPSMHVGVKFQL